MPDLKLKSLKSTVWKADSGRKGRSHGGVWALKTYALHLAALLQYRDRPGMRRTLQFIGGVFIQTPGTKLW